MGISVMGAGSGPTGWMKPGGVLGGDAPRRPIRVKPSGDSEGQEAQGRHVWLWNFRIANPDVRIVTPVFSPDEKWHAFGKDGKEIEAACLEGDNAGFAEFRKVMEDLYGKPSGL